MSDAGMIDRMDLTVQTAGEGAPVVVLHGGGGPASVAAIVTHLSSSYRVLAPTIPGWDGTDRPAWFTSIEDMAFAVRDLLQDEDLTDVVVVGSSIGGWIASTMAVLDADRGRITRMCLMDGVGVEIPGQTIRDFFSLDAHGVAEYSFHDGQKFYQDPASLTDAQKANQARNMASLKVLAGDPYMHDPHLIHRLDRVRIPVLGIWGDSDRIAPPEYGRAYVGAFPDSRFEIVKDAGHLPHIEQPDATWRLLDPFVAGERA